jgi:hypothetical protein
MLFRERTQYLAEKAVDRVPIRKVDATLVTKATNFAMRQSLLSFYVPRRLSFFAASLLLLLVTAAPAQVIFSDDFERATFGPDWTTEPFADWSIRNGRAYNAVEGPGGKLVTTQSFSETSYVLETVAYPFEYGYWREYFLTFGEQSTPDSTYAIRYDRAFGGYLSIVKSTGNIYFPEVLATLQIGLNDVDPLKLRVEHTDDGTIKLFIAEVGTAYADTALLQTTDTTYPNLGKLGWLISTQTAAQDFFVESISASVLPTSPVLFDDDFERAELGSFWDDDGGWVIQNGQAYNAPDNNFQRLTTVPSFNATSYILETEASNFVTGYYRDYFLIFGQQDSLANTGYVLNYRADFGNSLSLGTINGNYFFPTVLDDQVLTLDPAESYSFRIEKYDNGLIQVYLSDNGGYADVPVLEAIDPTYATLGRVSWSVATQTAGEDFFVEYIRAEVPAVQKTEPEKPGEDDLIKQVAVQSDNAYAISKLNEGETFFTDRPYTVTSVPEFLQGASFIKPPNDDKALTTGGDFMTVYLKETAIAYVAYDPRSTQLPAWLSDWTKTDLTIGTTDPGSPFYEVYSKRVPSAIFATYRNQLRIGANLASPAVGSNMNYLVAFVAAPNFARYEAEEATLSGPRVASNKSGFSGTGFADYLNKNNDYVEWTVDIAATAPYRLLFQYANGSNAARNMQVTIDGQEVGTVLGTPTSSWTGWRGENIDPVVVTAGERRIRLTALGNSGPNVDYLQITPSDQMVPEATSGVAARTASPKLRAAGEEAASLVQVYPNPTADELDFRLATGAAQLRVVDLQGREVYRHTFTGEDAANGSMQHHLDVSAWRTGTYLYRITTDEQTITGKVIKVP